MASHGHRPGASGGALTMLQLHHVGARSGAHRVTPLAYWPVTDTSVAVLASNFGAERHPAWYHNLVAQPDTSVEIDGVRWLVHARVAQPGERALLLDRIADSSTSVAAAMNRTRRQIAVVVLELVDPRGKLRIG